MKKWIFLIALFAGGYHGVSQVPDTITLDYCYTQAIKNYPLARQGDLLGRSSDIRIQNLNKNYLPAMNINGSASLQSDVTAVTIVLPKGLPEIGMPVPAKDQYRVTLDVNEQIWDGNITSYQKKVEDASLRVDQKNLQVQLYQLKDQVNQLYFSIFLNQENEELLNSSKERLESKIKEVRSAVLNGVQLQSNLDALDAEILLLDQQIIGLRTDRSASFKMLAELTSVNIPETSHLVLPDVRISSYGFENKRYENELYDLQSGKLNIMKNMVTTKWNPKFYAFGQLGYGRPGFNMLSNDFTPFWIFGGKLSWNFWNWNQNKNERRNIDLQRDIVTTQKETFEKNLRISNNKNVAEIQRLTGMLEKDEEIIALRSRITKSSSSQLDNGVITSSDFVNRVNEEIQANLSRELHRIQLVKAKISYLYTLGKL